MMIKRAHVCTNHFRSEIHKYCWTRDEAGKNERQHRILCYGLDHQVDGGVIADMEKAERGTGLRRDLVLNMSHLRCPWRGLMEASG
jgi:hypothetical protein